jgi:predicted metal-dependent hydrolase
MSELTVRQLLVDLSPGFDRHWHGGDAFLSQYYNALSMSFPVGEQVFIDSVRGGLAKLPDTPEHARLRADCAQFIGQEATHRQLHGLYNAHLERQGLVNRWQHWATARLAYAHERKAGVRHMLALTAAYEHCTAVFAECMLRYPVWFDGAEPRMRTLWLWHAAEETEHRHVVFDLYQSLGGNTRWRLRWYLYVLFFFTFDAARQTLLNLWHDGSLFKPSTWWNAARFFLGRDGALWRCSGPLLSYFRTDFHPSKESAKPSSMALADDWLQTHAESLRNVR